MDERLPDAEPVDRRHEVTDVEIRPIATWAVGLIVLTGVVLVLMLWLFTYFAARQAKLDIPLSPLRVTQETPPEPRLEVALDQVLREVRAHEAALLHSYAWVDRQAGVVRIPIERAMTRLIERGVPGRIEP